MTLTAAALAATMRLVASHAYPEGAPPGFSGGFKEDSCHACHFHEQPNSGGGRVTIEGVPPSFEAGQRYTLTVTLTRAGMKRAGFQLATRFKDSGAQAGTLAPGPGEGERVTVESQSGVQYAGQKNDGSAVSAADATRWTIEWTAPDRGGPVIVHVSANAADGNGSADGDFVYTAASESSPAFARGSFASFGWQAVARAAVRDSAGKPSADALPELDWYSADSLSTQCGSWTLQGIVYGQVRKMTRWPGVKPDPYPPAVAPGELHPRRRPA